MGMNQKTAFKILGIGPGASLNQAKKAFRNLAKQYHPDRYPPDLYPSDAMRAVRAEARMKQINQAFHFLAPLLNSADALSGKASKKTSPTLKKKKARIKTGPLFQDIIRMLKKGLKFKLSRKGGKPTPSVKQSIKSKVQTKSRAGNRDRFAAILHTLHPGAPADKKNWDNGPGGRVQSRDSRINPYGNFIKYMDLKKKIDARTRREQNFSRIEKIGVVTRVNPIGGKNKS